MGIHTGTPLAQRRGLRRRRRPPRGADRGRGPRRPGARLAVDARRSSTREGSRDLGEHRLKDLSRARARLPARRRRLPAAEDALTARTCRCPRRRSSVASGSSPRSRELLARDDVRLVTLTGPGRHGQDAARAPGRRRGRRTRFPDGVFWVPLAPLRTRRSCSPTIAQALGAERAGRTLPATSRSADGKRCCSLLDNAEHSAPERAGALAGCSRRARRLDAARHEPERLQLRASASTPVPPLRRGGRRRAFVARARGARSGVRRRRQRSRSSARGSTSCRWRSSSPPHARRSLARRSSSSGSTQRLDLLNGGRDADRASRRCARRSRGPTTCSTQTSSGSSAARGLRRRLHARGGRGGLRRRPRRSQSLARQEPAPPPGDRRESRYWMLETIREYAQEQLERSGEAEALRDRLADHSLALAELSYTERFERGLTWARSLDEEHDNLRAALDDLRGRDPLRYLQLAGALGWFWLGERITRRATQTRRRVVRRVEAAAHGPGADLLRAVRCVARAWRGRARSARGGDCAWGTVGAETEVLAARDELAWALYGAGGQESRALELFQQNLELARRSSHEPLVSRSLAGVCQCRSSRGEFERGNPWHWSSTP